MNIQSHSDFRTAQRRLPFECVALVLQGGGALGAYQAGVYEALAEAGIHPDWVAGVSIGAINSAIIAGNEPAERVAKLRAFWQEITANPLLDWSCRCQRLHSERRSAARTFQPDQRDLRARRGRPGLFHASAARSLAAPERRDRGDELLRNQAPEEHAGAAYRLRPDQCPAKCASASARSTCAPAISSTSTTKRTRSDPST